MPADLGHAGGRPLAQGGRVCTLALYGRGLPPLRWSLCRSWSPSRAGHSQLRLRTDSLCYRAVGAVLNACNRFTWAAPSRAGFAQSRRMPSGTSPEHGADSLRSRSQVSNPLRSRSQVSNPPSIAHSDALPPATSSGAGSRESRARRRARSRRLAVGPSGSVASVALVVASYSLPLLWSSPLCRRRAVGAGRRKSQRAPLRCCPIAASS
jgi:hypothetical protein